MTSTPPDDELWVVEQVAAHLGIAPGSVRRTLHRLGVRAASYTPHPDSGRPRAEYRAADVRTAAASRPGRGTRTDLKETN